MDNNKEFSCVERNQKVFSKNIETEEDFSLTLPAYCDDVYRIVKCTAHNYITSASVSGSEVNINGKCEIMLTYYNENSCLCYADFEEEFSKNIKLESISDSAFAICDICDKYTNFRVINQRKIDIHSSAVISLSVWDKVKYPCLTYSDNSRLKKDVLAVSDVVASNISKIEFDEEFSIPADSEPINRIISSECFSSIIETKLIKDKYLIKAKVNNRILYTAGNDDAILSASNSFDISKIIDVSGIEDNDIIISNLNLGSIFQKAKTQSGDKQSVIEVFGEIIVDSIFIRESENEYVTDGYLLKKKSNCSYSDMNTIYKGTILNNSSTYSISLDTPNNIKEIKDVSVKLSPISMRNSKPVSKAEILMLYNNDIGVLCSFTSSADVVFDSKSNEQGFFSANILSVDYSMNGDSKLDIRLNIDYGAYLYDKNSIRLLSDMEEGADIDNSASLTLYFAKKNENIWDIAKSFSSDCEMILAENELSDETLDNNKILIIPRV